MLLSLDSRFYGFQVAHTSKTSLFMPWDPARAESQGGWQADGLAEQIFSLKTLQQLKARISVLCLSESVTGAVNMLQGLTATRHPPCLTVSKSSSR